MKAPASAYHGFFLRAFYGQGLGLFPEVDNELLGVENRDSAWLKGIMERISYCSDSHDSLEPCAYLAHEDCK